MWKPEPNNKNCLQDCRKKHNIMGDIKTLLGKECEVKEMMRFFREIGLFEEI